MSAYASLANYAFTALRSSDPLMKAEIALYLFKNNYKIKDILMKGESFIPPEYPSRPETPVQVEINDMKNHKKLNIPLNIYLVHSLCHIELNAIDLYWDLILRSAILHESNQVQLPLDYFQDFLSVVQDESRHFNLLSNRLLTLKSHYGVIPAHKGLRERERV